MANTSMFMYFVFQTGDGRNDSPGHCAQYCTYTVMDYHTCDILDIEIVDKREAELKSTNMEKIAFVRSLEVLEKSDVKVEEIVTDAHPQIKAYISKKISLHVEDNFFLALYQKLFFYSFTPCCYL